MEALKTLNKAKKTSIFIPARNEEGNIPLLLQKIDKAVKALELDAELIVVNDGSSDRTGSLLESYRQSFGVIILDPLALFLEEELQKVHWNSEVEPVLTEIKRKFGCSIILNHNLRKKVQVYGHSEDLFAPDRLKGVSDIIDRADNIVMLVKESQPRKDEDRKSYRVLITWIHAAKTRDAEVELPFHRVKWDSRSADDDDEDEWEEL